MDTTTEMFIGFLIVEWIIFLPLIVIGVIGVACCKWKLKQIDQELEDMDI